LAIQYDALVERVAEHAPRVQMRLSPRVECARNDIAVKSAPGYGPVRLVVIQQSLANDEEIVIALRSMVPTRAAPEQDDRAGVKTLNETADRLGEACIMYRWVLHTDGNIPNRAVESNCIAVRAQSGLAFMVT
jgi:hypothetical protein